MMIGLNTNISKKTAQPLRFGMTPPPAAGTVDTWDAFQQLKKTKAKEALAKSLALPKPEYAPVQKAVINGAKSAFSFLKKTASLLK